MMSVAARIAAGLVLGTGVAVASWFAARAASPGARAWRPGAGDVTVAGSLGVRVFGSGHAVVLLIPGIAASQTFFGAAYDELGDRATVVVIDPLGFGDSMVHGTAASTVSLSSHVAAIDGALDALGLADRPTLAVGHSMGASLALQWAATASTVGGVVAFDAPLYRSRAEADERVAGMGWFEALMAGGPIAERTCAWVCENRDAAAALAVALNPDLPSTVARAGVQHTWEAYRRSFDALVAGQSWEGALDRLAARGVPVRLVDGDRDPVPVPGRARELADRHDSVVALELPGRHDLPLAGPALCVGVIEHMLAALDEPARR